jgi:hypothetical protein
MAVFPEAGVAESGDGAQVELLACKEERIADSWLEVRGLRRLVFLGVIAACALGAAFLVLGLLYLLLPESSFTSGATLVVVLVFLVLFVTLPVGVALSALVVRVLFGRRGRRAPGFDLRRSVVAVTAGVATLVAAGFIVIGLRSSLDLEPDPGALRWLSLFLGDAAAGILAGLVTVRLARSAPYRHTVAVGLVLVLGLTLPALPLAGSRPLLPLGALAYLAFVPMLLLGSWIGVRLGLTGRELAGPPA